MRMSIESHRAQVIPLRFVIGIAMCINRAVAQVCCGTWNLANSWAEPDVSEALAVFKLMLHSCNIF